MPLAESKAKGAAAEDDPRAKKNKKNATSSKDVTLLAVYACLHDVCRLVLRCKSLKISETCICTGELRVGFTLCSHMPPCCSAHNMCICRGRYQAKKFIPGKVIIFIMGGVTRLVMMQPRLSNLWQDSVTRSFRQLTKLWRSTGWMFILVAQA